MNENHQSWSQTTQYLVASLLIAAALLFVYFARELVGSLIIAALITSLLMPIVNGIERVSKLGHRVSAVAVYIVFLLALVALPALFAPQIVELFSSINASDENIVKTINDALDKNPTFYGYELPLLRWAESITATPTWLNFSRIAGFFNGLSANLIWILTTLITIFYLLQDWHKLREWMFEQVPDYRRDEMRRLYSDIRNVWQAYMRGQFVLSLVIGTATALGAMAIGLKGALFIGALAAIFDVLPSVGPLIPMAIGGAVGLYTGSATLGVPNWVFAIIVLLMFVTIQTIENIWWRPRIMGSSLKMHPSLVFIGVMGSIALSGIFLTLIIVPVMGTVGVLWRYVRARMIGISPWPDDVDPPHENRPINTPAPSDIESSKLPTVSQPQSSAGT